MMQATNLLFMRAGVSFVVEPSDEPYKKITLKLDNVTPEEAVQYICQAAGAYFRRDDNNVYVITHTKPKAVEPVAAIVGKAPRLLKRIKLMKSDSRDVYDQLLYGTPVDLNRGFAAMKKFMPQAATEYRNMYGPNSTPQTTQTPFQTFNSNPVSTSNLLAGRPEGASDVTIPGDESAKQLGGGGFGGGGGGFGGAGQGGGGGFGGQGGAGGQGGQGNARLQGGVGLVPEGIDFISYDPTDNSLVVKGDEDAINELQQRINIFDVAPRQVQIKVEFITTTNSLDTSFGTEFLYQRGTELAGTNPGSFIRASDPVFLNFATGNITARLRTSLTHGNGKVVSAPILRTLNNQPASINSSIQTTIFINNTTVSNGAVVTSTTPTALIASTFLAVAPRINEDGTITVYLSPNIANFVGFSTGPNGEQVPNLVQQNINVVARVRNNETIVLGGLTQKNEDENVTSVPVLGELPIIGQFFRFSTKNHSNSELLIFVTPTIIEDDSTGTSGGP